MSTRTVRLTDRQDQFVEEQVRTGGYPNADEVVRAAVDLLKERKAILMVSSDMPEVISMSDRVIVFKQGQIAGELTGEEITEENILTLSIGDRQE